MVCVLLGLSCVAHVPTQRLGSCCLSSEDQRATLAVCHSSIKALVPLFGIGVTYPQVRLLGGSWLTVFFALETSTALLRKGPSQERLTVLGLWALGFRV